MRKADKKLKITPEQLASFVERQVDKGAEKMSARTGLSTGFCKEIIVHQLAKEQGMVA